MIVYAACYKRPETLDDVIIRAHDREAQFHGPGISFCTDRDVFVQPCCFIATLEIDEKKVMDFRSQGVVAYYVSCLRDYVKAHVDFDIRKEYALGGYSKSQLFVDRVRYSDMMQFAQIMGEELRSMKRQGDGTYVYDRNMMDVVCDLCKEFDIQNCPAAYWLKRKWGFVRKVEESGIRLLKGEELLKLIV